MKDITCIEDLRELHRRKVPKAFFDYVDHGSYAEQTLHANRTDLEALKFRQRILVDISVRDQKTTILGEPVSMPLILAPVGSTGMQIGDGEILARRPEGDEVGRGKVCAVDGGDVTPFRDVRPVSSEDRLAVRVVFDLCDAGHPCGFEAEVHSAYAGKQRNEPHFGVFR